MKDADTPSDITARQASILGFIQRTINHTGRPPTIREIGKHFGFKSTGTTRDHLKSLSRKGFITLTPRQSRAINLKTPVAFRIPMIGSIVAGMPDIALEEIDEYVYLDEFLPGPDKQIFALKVRGDSMKDAGINPGDIAIVRRQRIADAGQVVAALVGHEATIKTLEKNKAGFYLKPANASYPDIREPFSILGKVIAVIKKF
ncbi:MAG: transcriptional repressor LexA [Candidatus Omnitrophota bacterium]|jgi:repressor LexA|nr:transcriptional repressor LexA [Candidatus Omnitrophota bacterium]MDD5137977.1 transcriptional repressor LexA [Candidatus Omnitrophota bacterium]MDD5537735.1 transcriptional repressor LexA [Candidatus Omnitrophota bacterium]